MRYSRITVSDTGVTEESQHTVYVKLALTNWCLHDLEMIDHCATDVPNDKALVQWLIRNCFHVMSDL